MGKLFFRIGILLGAAIVPLSSAPYFDEIANVQEVLASDENKYTLKTTDVRDTFEQILGFHVTHRKMNPLIIKRACKVYLEHFDRTKMYLLASEMEKVVGFSQRRLESGVEKYLKDDLSDFMTINKVIARAISRAQEWRCEIQKKWILSAADIEESRGESYLSYANTEAQLRERIARQQMRLLMEEKRFNQMVEWSPVDREKIFALWERRLQRREVPYLEESHNPEHYLALHTLSALATSLDAHTEYFSPESARAMRTALEKQFEGVGVVLREGIDGVVIIDLVSGGPADRNDRVHIGDQIIEIDGQVIAGMTYEEVLKAMKGTGSKELRLALNTQGKNTLHRVVLEREKIMMNDERLQYDGVPVEGGQIGILTLPSFYEGGHGSSAEKDMREALIELKKQAPLKGVILDMRENSGGFLTQAVKIAGLFITKGVVVISKYGRGEIKYLRNLDGRLYFDGPLLILTSKASASATEIVAQALQDYGAALIVGDEHTYGKGTIQYQTVTTKSAKSFYKVTVGRYYTVSGRSTQIEGVKADIVVPTIFASYKIGERFLEYPLPSDQVAAAYVDPLTDIDYRSRSWFQKNYLPYLHSPQEKWQKIVPTLAQNSLERQQTDPNFSLFLKVQSKQRGKSPSFFRIDPDPPWGKEDLQLAESVNIMKDMLDLESL